MGTRGHSVCIPSPMMHLPASAAPTVSHYVSISLDYLLIAQRQLFSLSLTVVVHCLTFWAGAAETPPPSAASTGGITRGESGPKRVEGGRGRAKDNMEVFLKNSFHCTRSRHPFLSDVTAGHVCLAERRVGTLSCHECRGWGVGKGCRGARKKQVEKKARHEPQAG